MWYKNAGTIFFRFTDRRSDRQADQADGQTEFSSLDRVCIPCSEVKINAILLNNEIN